ncbi:4-hydroxythreonine-4-phosphate dehydrogenase PdxA [Moraxella sp. VT-16-12]|uniref:4-hydroxythreonine-4-phosphate dehydrogenase PdxA n=1 Tax=Moraxella sp. VT-16-12 TaxID=2014877 RepID=UPI000B7ED72A|nr:4-hydroxythreonine-4-phosphate dehydrogenase PdxA [Moraxella sp. VT-16-12]TWV80680.1 4-hydroxythreonine-4-phosphate dehydrogenase PdxA [Moraxella sp. VT-16-12]
MKSIIITTGEPAGIGMDIVLDVLCHHRHILPSTTYITACHQSLNERMQMLGITMDLPIMSNDDVGKDGVFIIDIPCHDKVMAGQLNQKNALMVLSQLDLAHQWAMTGKVGAIVTAPISKAVMIDGGICLDNGDKFSGHTEFFMHKAQCHKVVMMLANTKMKVALVTTHLPLKDVPDAINAQEIISTVKITHRELQEKFGIAKPRLLVCGLNPHAGEDGHLGTEEQTIINPALKQCQHDGINVSLAMPADTMFTPHHLSQADAIIAMYHDQGLAPLKSHGFGDTVNITLGLPYVRTSVDHGTALDLAGTAKASSSSLLQAINIATSALTDKF